MAEPVDLDLRGFQPQVVDKVLRLLGVLDAIGADQVLSPVTCLHGGTALNLFVLGAPRLSVDIDLNYVGSTDLETLQTERPKLEQRVVDVAENLGFEVTAGKAEHSGRTFRLRYLGASGPDWVKIDLDYLNRSPLLGVMSKALRLDTGTVVEFPLNSDIELVAGKTKALVERVAVRDLYDVNRLAAHVAYLLTAGDARLLRRVTLYYLSISAPFPRPLHIAGRFLKRQRDVVDQLYPMLRTGDRPTLDDMISVAEKYLANASQPSDDAEAQYLERAAHADFFPELLFSDYPKVLTAAQTDPAARWKMRNLAKSLTTDSSR